MRKHVKVQIMYIYRDPEKNLVLQGISLSLENLLPGQGSSLLPPNPRQFCDESESSPDT